MRCHGVRRTHGKMPFILTVCVALLFFGCDDHGVEADFFKGTVKGELQIETVVPDTTDEIRVALVDKFPPSSLQGLLTSSVIPVKKDPELTNQTVPFEMQAPYGTYDAAIVIWKAKAQSFQLNDIVGLHGNLESFDLKKVVLTSESPIDSTVNIPVDLSRVDRTSAIRGTVNFVGDWPSNTSVVVLVVLSSLADLTSGIPPGIVFIPNESRTFEYRVGVAPGIYRFIAVAWLPIGQIDLSKLRILGFYEENGLAGTIEIGDRTTVSNIDVTADFANIE